MAALAQQAAPSNVRGGEYPKIDSDCRVTFRVKAPNATNVAVAARADDSGMNGNKSYAMSRGENGLWIVTTDPVRPGFHRHVWVDTPGSHEWQVWHKYLLDLAPRLFQD